MPTLLEAIEPAYRALTEQFGRTPAGFEGLEPFEAMIAVLLERAAGPLRWKAALQGLSQADLLDPETLAETDLITVREAVRDNGPVIAAEKLAPLQRLARWLAASHGGRTDSLFNPDRSTGWLRGELAAIRGISVADADALLLYALKRPSYAVDRPTFRILARHGWLDATATYDEARQLMVDGAEHLAEALDQLPEQILAELAQGMKRVGRRFCRAAAPLCEGCPFETLLPAGGPHSAGD
jgi:endonuclease-3 related protein